MGEVGRAAWQWEVGRQQRKGSRTEEERYKYTFTGDPEEGREDTR